MNVSLTPELEKLVLAPMSTAKLYGFTALDLNRSKYSKWKKVAILVKANEWTADSMDLIEKLSAKVIPISSGDLSEIHKDLPRAMDSLVTAA